MVKLDQDGGWHLPDKLWQLMDPLLPSVRRTRWIIIIRAFRNAQP